jgi:hypothetical protein
MMFFNVTWTSSAFALDTFQLLKDREYSLEVAVAYDSSGSLVFGNDLFWDITQMPFEF